jgi:DNA-binding PadR family transcriptional regulator
MEEAPGESLAPFLFVLDGGFITFYDTTWNVIMTDPTLLVLSSLAGGNKHGYAMMEDIEQFAGVRLGPGTLYGAIARLEKEGWIRPVKATERRQPYTLTAAGRRHLESQVASLSAIVGTAAGRLGAL